MIRKTKISAVLLALMFAAGGAMAQSAGSSSGTSMSNTGDDNARAADSPVGTATKNSATSTKKSSSKAKAPKKAKRMNDGSGKSSSGDINTDPNGNVSNPENRPTTNP